LIYGHRTTNQGEWNEGKLPLKFSHGKKKEDADVLNSLNTRTPEENFDHLKSRVKLGTKIFYSNDTTKGSHGSPVLTVAKTKDDDTTLSVIGILDQGFNINAEKNNKCEKTVNFAHKLVRACCVRQRSNLGDHYFR
jgi:V8-like Glu-specific endopeptidase